MDDRDVLAGVGAVPGGVGGDDGMPG